MGCFRNVIFPGVSKPIRYEDRGASADKAEVHKAIAGEHPGLFPGAFCKVLPDTLTGSPDHCLLIHADGAGTKSILAYLHWKETGDLSAFRGLAQDSLVMNIDDLACVGVFGPFLLSNTIGRNAKIIPGDAIAEIIGGYRDCIAMFAEQGIVIESGGGETADLGDTVRTLVVDSTLVARATRKQIVSGDRLKPGLAIVGLYSGGRASYETAENSGLGSNGYTMLRHEFLSPHYKTAYPEAYAPEIAGLAYTGKYRMSDTFPGANVTVGQTLLSPTRTYAPILKAAFAQAGDAIAAIFHNTGGGQTKCLRFGSGLTYIKDNLFDPPPAFRALRDNPAMAPRELYRTLNMGHRMEIVCEPSVAEALIHISKSFNVDARIVGRTEPSAGANRLILNDGAAEYTYEL
ncbi:MAG: phosphoribosylformylglycinamidine cyclo-ligase [Fibrobacteres bacterium]|nr:phosphoribosylformylglycinamidine cyclo-ligase [Fibrobacterota bacterium]